MQGTSFWRIGIVPNFALDRVTSCFAVEPSQFFRYDNVMMTHSKSIRLVLLAVCGFILSPGCGTETSGFDNPAEESPEIADGERLNSGNEQPEQQRGVIDGSPVFPSPDEEETEDKERTKDGPVSCDLETGFACPCEKADDCQSGLCVPSSQGDVCTMPCTSDCPQGWSCVLFPGDGGESLFACAPNFVDLCRPCMESAQCENAFEVGKCIKSGPQGAFCGVDCSPEKPESCPAGYSCSERESVEGVVSNQCVIDSEAGCACSPLAIEQQAITSCVVENEFGQCEGTRSCGEDGLSPCSGDEPLAEICNGQDDDCDGLMDDEACPVGQACGCDESGDCACSCGEGLTLCGDVCVSLQTDPLHCGSCDLTCEAPGVAEAACVDGICKVITCEPGLTKTDDVFETGCGCTEETEICDGKDNDCDGLVDSFSESCDTICGAGTKTCQAGVWTECDAPDAVVCMDYTAGNCEEKEQCEPCSDAPEETCNGIDDNCNGLEDEGFSCKSGQTKTIPCGACGQQELICENCAWVEVGLCEGEGQCIPGAETTESCGIGCGVQNGTCNDACQWDFDVCQEPPSPCLPGDVETDSCGNCGERERVCTGSCVWGEWEECKGQGVCSPGSSEDLVCGKCGIQTRDCTGSCSWTDWSSCAGEGVCVPGDLSSQNCGDCGTQERVCEETCNWGDFGDCQSSAQCTPGAQESQNCGNCGVQTRTCLEGCGWSAWSTCSDEGECSPGDLKTESCGNCGTATAVCDAGCQFGAFGACENSGVCSPGDLEEQECGNCGLQTRTCTAGCGWGTWSQCAGSGVCSSGEFESQSCGFCGTQGRVCSDNCGWGAWDTCDDPGECNDGDVQTQTGASCGNCGVESMQRVCNGCTWGAWEVTGCLDEGICVAGTVENQPGGSCGFCGTEVEQRTCLNSCQWTDWEVISCEGQGTCDAGSTETMMGDPCGLCGAETLERSCSAECDWTPWSVTG